MNVEAIMKVEFGTLKPEDSLETAIRSLVWSGTRHMLVVDGRSLVGIVSEWDLLRAYSRNEARRAKVRDVMTANVHVVAPDAPVASMVARLVEERLGCLPVVRNGELVGMITMSDVVAFVGREIFAATPTGIRDQLEPGLDKLAALHLRMRNAIRASGIELQGLWRALDTTATKKLSPRLVATVDKALAAASGSPPRRGSGSKTAKR